jgi:hypothetical protein
VTNQGKGVSLPSNGENEILATSLDPLNPGPTQFMAEIVGRDPTETAMIAYCDILNLPSSKTVSEVSDQHLDLGQFRHC